MSGVNIEDYCSFSASTPGDDWIEAVYIEDQNEKVLLDVGPYAFHSTGHRDNTEYIISCYPGDILTISVTVNAGSSTWTQALSWGHTIFTQDLVTVNDLHKASGCPWTHTYTWEVPDEPGLYLISWWEHYNNYNSGCGSFSFAERHSYTLEIIELVPTAAIDVEGLPVNIRSTEATVRAPVADIEVESPSILEIWDNQEFGDDIVGVLYWSERLVLTGSGPTHNFTGSSMHGATSNSPVSNDSRVRRITVESGITTIGNQTFRKMPNVIEINIPNTVTSIGDWGAYQCTSLTSIDIPTSVTSTGNRAFGYCALDSLTIAHNLGLGFNVFTNNPFANGVHIAFDVTTVAGSPFHECNLEDRMTFEPGLSAVPRNIAQNSGLTVFPTLPSSITTIRQYAFASTQLGEVNPPDHIQVIEQYAFGWCYDLTSFTMGEESSLQTLGGRVFLNCTGLTGFEMPSTLTSVGIYAFRGSGLVSIEIPSNVSPGNGWFFQCPDLVQVVCPDNWNNVPYEMCFGCASLTSVHIPESAETIWGRSFQLCSSLPSVVIPENVNRIETTAFRDTHLLETIENNYNGNQTLGTNVFVDAGRDVSPKTAYCYEVNTNFITAVEAEGYTVVYLDIGDVYIKPPVSEINLSGIPSIVKIDIVPPDYDKDVYVEIIKSSLRQIRSMVGVYFTEGSPTIFEGDDIFEIRLLEEAAGTGDTPGNTPLGVVVSNELTLSLNNSDKKFTPSNPDRIFDVRPGLKIVPFLVVELPNENAIIPLGTFWSGEWQTPSNSLEARTVAHDRLADVINIDTPQIPPITNTNVAEMYGILFQYLGLQPNEYIINASLTQPLEIGWFSRDVVGVSLQTLAEAGNCSVSVDRYNRITVQPNLRSGEPLIHYDDEDIFSINNPQNIDEIYTAIKMQYRIPYLKPPNKNLVRADGIVIPDGGILLDRIDFHSDDIPVLQVDWVHLYNPNISGEVWDLFLGDPSNTPSGTFKLYDGTDETGDIAHDATNADIQTELESIYGETVEVKGADRTFEIKLGVDSGRTDLKADFSNLENLSNPSLLKRRSFSGPVQSEVLLPIGFGATDIQLDIKNDSGYEETVNVEVKGQGTGHHIGHNVVINAEAAESYGHRELSLENHLIQSQNVAKSHAELLIGYISDPLAIFEVEYRGNPFIEVGDIITIESAQDKVPPTDVLVRRVELTYDGGLSSRILCRRVI